MRILTPLICNVLVACPVETKAAEAELKIVANIISYKDWKKMDSEKLFDITVPKSEKKQLVSKSTGTGNVSTDSLQNRRTYNAQTGIKNLSAENRFRLMDINNDNLITQREYLISTGTPVNDSDFDKYDRNRDGFLTRDEFNQSGL